MSVNPIKIQVPGSKSITNRVLLLASLSDKPIEIKNIGLCDDTKYMIEGLKKIRSANPSTTNNPTTSKNSTNKPIKIFTANAGTATRFLTALATLQEKTIIIDGDKRMRERPISELTNALNTLGAKITSKNGVLPITIHPKKLQGGKLLKIKGNISSQYLSALLMTTPFATKNTTIKIEQKLCSTPYVKMTLSLLTQFGIKIVNKNFKQFIIQGNQKIRPPKTITIESDASSASYIGAYSALQPATPVFLEGITKNSIQGDIKFLDYLKKMGCKITFQKTGTLIKGVKTLKSLGVIDMNETPDLVMTFAILAIFTKGITKITNIKNLKIKETDRLQALKNEISKLGIKVKTSKNFIEIHGNPALLSQLKESSSPTSIETYNDHRIAMSFAIAQDLLPFIKIKNRNCVSKSYTRFWNDLKKIQNHGK
ncbi:MAG: 3-phosphoshikimate 1-carboxyvinyltransferase [Candidatus Gracilibacteria bacterium]|nr:3-phosphoshikimate 1-carboxyvinyltransferase [Candidatus Gracilibacteria bacterium]